MNEDFIYVSDFETECHIGIYPEEKKKKQKIKISVSLKISRISFDDKISTTVSYKKILDALANVSNLEHINLVETLAYRLADEFERISQVKKIIIKIIKCEIARSGTDVGYILKRTLKN